MKAKILTLLAFIGFIGSVHAEDAAVFVPSPVVSKCMVLHQRNTIAQMVNTPEHVRAAKDYLERSFTPDQINAYHKLIKDWNSNENIRDTYNGLKGSDYYGKSLTPAIMMAACIKAM